MIFDFLKKNSTADAVKGGISQTFKIVDMHCASCAINIDDGLEEQAGVLKSQTKYAQAKTVVSFEPDKISVAELQKKIKELGYTAEPVN